MATTGAERDFPVPAGTTDLTGFVRALRDIKVWAGNPSLETLRRRTGVATSTLSDAFSVQRRRLPSLEIVRAIALACGADRSEALRWEQAWRALAERLDAVAAPPPRPASLSQAPLSQASLRPASLPSAPFPSAPFPPASFPSASFPPGEQREWIPRQLPSDVAGFSGRREALDALHAASGQATATVITGTVGVGKTALAVHWAHRIAERYPDGQLYLDLRGHSGDPTISPVEALPLLLQSLGVPSERIPADLPLQTGLYRSVLADRRCLVVLDNVVDSAHVRPLLPSGPGCHALITSRDALTGLVVREGAARITLDTLDETESVGLLTTHLGADRVQADPAAATELVALCARLPLALRIVAAKLAARPRHTLADAIRELRGTDLLGRLQVVGDPESAVAAAFDISYGALPAEAQRLFRRLGVVPGPEISREAAAVLLDRNLGDDVPELDGLVAAHLVSEYAPDRFRSHDLLSLYARRQATRESEEVRRDALHRLLSYYLLSADAARETLVPGRSINDIGALAPTGVPHTFDDPRDAVVWLETEWANLAAAIAYTADRDEAPFSWHLVYTVSVFLFGQGSGVAQLTTARAALRAAEAADNALGRAYCHNALGMANINLHRLTAASGEFAAAREQYLRVGEVRGARMAASNLGDVSIRTGDIARAVELFDDARTDGTMSTANEGLNVSNLAMVERIRGNHAEALRLDGLAHAFGVRTGDLLLTVTAEVGMAMTHLESGDPASAEPLLVTAHAAAVEAGSEIDLYDALAALVLVCARTGRHAEAELWAAPLRNLIDRGTSSFTGDDWGHAAIAESHLAAGHPERALTEGLPALDDQERAGYRLTAMRLRILLGRAHRDCDDLAAARALWQVALEYSIEQDLPDREGIAALLDQGCPV